MLNKQHCAIIVVKVIIMNVRHFIHSREELLKQGQEIVKQTSDSKFIHRVTMVNLILGGMKSKEVSQYCGDSVRTINTWVKKVDEEGWESLMTVKQKGRPATFSDTQLEEIKQAVRNDPENYGYHVWDGPTLSDYIKATYNIEYGTRACQKLFHRLGFSLIRPQTYPSLENPDNEARDELKKNSKK